MGSFIAAEQLEKAERNPNGCSPDSDPGGASMHTLSSKPEAIAWHTRFSCNFVGGLMLLTIPPVLAATPSALLKRVFANFAR